MSKLSHKKIVLTKEKIDAVPIFQKKEWLPKSLVKFIKKFKKYVKKS